MYSPLPNIRHVFFSYNLDRVYIKAPCLSFQNRNLESISFIRTVFIFLEQKIRVHTYYSDHVFLFRTKKWGPCLQFRPCLSFQNKNLESILFIRPCKVLNRISLAFEFLSDFCLSFQKHLQTARANLACVEHGPLQFINFSWLFCELCL